MEARPFHPFTMHLADGREIGVNHPELIAASPSGRTAVIFQPDDSMNIVDLLLVTDLEIRTNGHARPRRGGRR